MANPILSLALGVGLALSLPLSAADFSAADALFATRGEGLAQADAAKAKYRALVPSLHSNQDKIYAISQMSRLDIFVGGMLQGIDQDTRNERLDECMTNVDTIASTKSQEYYYFYLSCLAIRGKQAGVLQRLKYGMMMRSIQGDALESTKNAQGQVTGGFEGGGILRVISAVRANTKARPLGLYNAQEGVDFARVALDTPTQQVKPYGELSGRDYFENYFYLGRAEVNLGVEEDNRALVVQGKNTVLTALQKISDLRDFNDLPPGRNPETGYYEEELNGLNAVLNDCLSESDWKSCIVGKLN